MALEVASSQRRRVENVAGERRPFREGAGILCQARSLALAVAPEPILKRYGDGAIGVLAAQRKCAAHVVAEIAVAEMAVHEHEARDALGPFECEADTEERAS